MDIDRVKVIQQAENPQQPKHDRNDDDAVEQGFYRALHRQVGIDQPEKHSDNDQDDNNGDKVHGSYSRIRVLGRLKKMPRSYPPGQQQDQHDNQDHADHTHSAVAIAITIPAKAAAEPAEQGNNEKNDEQETQ